MSPWTCIYPVYTVERNHYGPSLCVPIFCIHVATVSGCVSSEVVVVVVHVAVVPFAPFFVNLLVYIVIGNIQLIFLEQIIVFSVS